MSETTGIAWTDHTFNPFIGCTKVSPGCKNCYAETLDTRYYGGTHWGKGAPRKRTSENTWKNPVKWNMEAGRRVNIADHRPRVFPSLCDWLDDEVPIEWLADFLKLIHDTPNLDWLLLTKRPENFVRRLSEARNQFGPMRGECLWLNDWIGAELKIRPTLKPPGNVWIGVSVEDQPNADKRIPQLLQIPAKVRFLSVEPLLERVNLGFSGADYDGVGSSKIQWVIVGGESGKDRRDCGVDAIRDVAVTCQNAKIPCFVKQDSAFKPGQRGRIPDEIWALKQFPK